MKTTIVKTQELELPHVKAKLLNNELVEIIVQGTEPGRKQDGLQPRVSIRFTSLAAFETLVDDLVKMCDQLRHQLERVEV